MANEADPASDTSKAPESELDDPPVPSRSPTPMGPPAHNRDEDIEGFLAQVPLLDAFPATALTELASATTWRHLRGGEYLFHQGDPPDVLALVWSGRLQVIDERLDGRGGDGPDQVISVLGRGSWVGELSLLTGAPRSAAVRALRDSQLLIVPAAAFAQVVDRDSTIGLAIARVFARQLQAAPKVAAPVVEPDTIAVIPLGETVPLDRLIGRLRGVLAASGAVAVQDARPDGTQPLDAATAVPVPTGDDFAVPDDEQGRAWADRLDHLESTNRWVVLVAPRPAADPEWAAFCVRSADRTLVLVRGGKPPSWADDLLADAGSDAIFVGTSLSAARMTPALHAIRPRTHHHLAEGEGFDRSADRIARRASGQAIGLVFSGGGARGLAHLGVIDALVGANVAIDRVGGCSAGSFAAGLYAMGRSPDEMREIVVEELVEHRPFTDFGVPREGLIKGKKALAMLERVFGETRIEELSMSMFAVSADLTTGELVVHRSGLLRDAIAASMSIPGVAPPIHRDGKLLVDGGILNNLPVDVMQADEEGPIIAVDVIREFQMPAPGSDKPGFGLRESVGPGIVSTIARSMMIGGWQRSRTNRRLADLLISPDVDSIGMFDFDRFEDAFAAGRAATTAALADGLPT